MDAASAPAIALVGIGSFLKRPWLWYQLIAPIIATLISTIVSFSVLMKWALHPQADKLIGTHWPAWIAWISSFLLVVAEVALINLIILLVLFGCVQSKITRAILEEKGILPQLRSECEAHGRELPEAYCMRDLAHNILFLVARLPLLLLTLPLHGIPALGQIIWVFLNGWIYTWELESEFLVMARELHHCGEQWRFVHERFGSFAGFGAAAMGLELIPFVGPWIFFASNACGAALLAERFFKETHTWSDGRWIPRVNGYGSQGHRHLS